MTNQSQTTKSRREQLIVAVEKVGIPEAVRRIESVVQETTRKRRYTYCEWCNIFYGRYHRILVQG